MNIFIVNRYTYIYKNNIMTNSQANLRLRMTTLKLSHGQALRVMTDTGLAAGMTDTALNSMVKKFRLNGLPFERKDEGTYQWEETVYHYEHLVELALALKMLSDGMAFRHIVSLLTKYRSKLRGFYNEALISGDTGKGSPRTIINPDPFKGELTEIQVSGLYLEFKALARNGSLNASEPELISPWMAVERYMACYDGLYPFPLIMLTQICQRVLKVAEGTPPVRRGRRG